ncbi:hypothetical protein N8I84_20105 [Streptomyces cynarae]|uniref:Uncharacterized protein n=1 Tax=Streptomyces cynarae TaxID=2981134 RepID=A0ABY6E2B0_9ACTN|nr:hypothetical protein [Streptomyces cynarae]UXY20745.1 hypothetical protein N8I84_20105 [Streptomyces cynarae]
MIIAALIAGWIVVLSGAMAKPGGLGVVDWGFGGVIAVGLFLMIWLTIRARDTTQAESRARVREAEEGLEAALRGSASTGVVALGDRAISVSGNHHGPVVVTDSSSSPSANGEQDVRQTRLTLSELWTVTHRRLDHYHGIALGQAKQSFLNAQIAMGLGFALLIGFVIVALNASTVAGSIVAGGLGAVSAALAGYVSRTFIRSQEAAAGHLRAYFDQPLEFSRYLAAERLMADAGLSEEHRAEVLSLLVQTMITGPVDPSPASTTEEQPGRTS